MPHHLPKYPKRSQVVDYLEDYARHFNIQPRFGERLGHARREQGRWIATTTSGANWSAAHLVICTGANRVPVCPKISGLKGFPGPVVHSSEYKNASEWTDKRGLVVGCGNSGAEIALDIHEHGGSPTLVVRSPIHVSPRDLLGRGAQETSMLMSSLPVGLADAISVLTLKLVVGDLSKFGIHRPKKGPIRLIVEDGRVSLLDVGTLALIRSGELAVVPGVRDIDGQQVSFVDGSSASFDAIVLATGFRADLYRLVPAANKVRDRHGQHRPFGGDDAPGLFLVGFRNVATGLLREIGIEAVQVAQIIHRANLPGGRRV